MGMLKLLGSLCLDIGRAKLNETFFSEVVIHILIQRQITQLHALRHCVTIVFLKSQFCDEFILEIWTAIFFIKFLSFLESGCRVLQLLV